MLINGTCNLFLFSYQFRGFVLVNNRIFHFGINWLIICDSDPIVRVDVETVSSSLGPKFYPTGNFTVLTQSRKVNERKIKFAMIWRKTGMMIE